MAVTYRRRRQPASTNLIERLEQRLRHTLPSSYREYLAQQDGGRLADNDQAVKTVLGLGDVGDMSSIWKILDIFADRVPTWLLPVAIDECGNLFAVSLRDEDFGSVWFWDHEEEADEGEPPTEDNIEMRAPDWATFLNSLGPC